MPKKESKELPEVITYLLMKEKFDNMYAEATGLTGSSAVQKCPQVESPKKPKR